MTKKIIRTVYFAYHILFPSRVNTCRFEPTCSKYALEAYEKYGLLKGTALTVKRLFSCHPFSNSPIIDPLI